MRVDPGADVRPVGIPEHLRALRTEREMKAQPGIRRDADPAAGKVAEQDRARRLTEPDGADVHTAGRKARPARVVLRDVATAVTIDVNGFRHHGGGETAHEGGQSHRSRGMAPFTLGVGSTSDRRGMDSPSRRLATFNCVQHLSGIHPWRQFLALTQELRAVA
jgi:hypothetical protein